MSDERLRELERRWQATGDPVVEAELLRHLLRLGALDPEGLRLAVHLGHEAAALALDEPPSQGSESSDASLRGWARGLEPWGWRTHLRAGLTTVVGRRLTPVLREVCQEVQAHLATVDRVSLQRRAAPARALLERLRRGEIELGSARHLARELAELIADTHVHPSGEVLAAHTARQLGDVLVVAAGRDGEAGIRQRVRDALVPWALGRGDPLTDAGP